MDSKTRKFGMTAAGICAATLAVYGALLVWIKTEAVFVPLAIGLLGCGFLAIAAAAFISRVPWYVGVLAMLAVAGVFTGVENARSLHVAVAATTLSAGLYVLFLTEQCPNKGGPTPV